MKKIILGLAASLGGLGLAVSGLSASVNTAGPTPTVQVQQDTAAAGVGGSFVDNIAGSPVYLRKSFKGAPYSTLGTYDKKIYEGSNSKPWSGDLDQFRSQGDRRCIKYVGPGYADGWYKIEDDYWYKVSDLASVYVREYGYYQCDGRGWFKHDGPGGLTAP